MWLRDRPSSSARIGPLSTLAWSLYAFAWLTFAGGHAAMYVMGGASLASAWWMSVQVMLPAALLGIPALLISDRMTLQKWRPHLWMGIHLGVGLLYAISWTAGVNLLMTLQRTLASGTLQFRLPAPAVLHWHLLVGVLLYLLLALTASVLAQTRAREQERREAELSFLLAKINPHFLFNTLHSLQEMITTNDGDVEEAVDHLAQLLRRVLLLEREGERMVSLSEEWRFVLMFLHLERLRFGERLQVRTEIDPGAAEALVPAFILQLLVENAVQHGVRSTGEEGAIQVSVSREDGQLHIQVRNRTVSDNFESSGPSSVRKNANGFGARFVKQLVTSAGGDVAIDSEALQRGWYDTRVTLPFLEEAE